MSSVDDTALAGGPASDGFAGREHALREVAATARAQGLPAVLTGILADPTEPEVARLRAFGRIATLLAATAAPGRVTRAA
jgi:hypothetical protein